MNRVGLIRASAKLPAHLWWAKSPSFLQCYGAGSACRRAMKRDSSGVGGVSPPPTKRKLESTTTNKAVANFFTPKSQKFVAPISWRSVHETLLVGHFKDNEAEPSTKRRKIAAFDFDSTLIKTSSGNVFGKDASDWRWLDNKVPTRLRQLYEDGYRVIVISNQGGIKLETIIKPSKQDAQRLSNFKEKVGYVFNQLDFPLSIYAATAKDRFRKPRPGMWTEFLEDYDLDEGPGPDLGNSFFVGDAAGRMASKGRKADHSNGDRNFAANVGMGFYTPEEYFLEDKPLEWKRNFDPVEHRGPTEKIPPLFERTNPFDLVLLVGSPGAGKSTFYQTWLKPLGYERINQDILKTRNKCVAHADAYLAQKIPVAVDNTNADVQTRAVWVEAAQRAHVPIRCVLLETPAEACRHNDTVRAMHSGDSVFNPEKREMLPTMAFTGFQSRYRQPELAEGFQDITRVAFKFHGDEEHWNIWSQYWV